MQMDYSISARAKTSPTQTQVATRAPHTGLCGQKRHRRPAGDDSRLETAISHAAWAVCLVDVPLVEGGIAMRDWHDVSRHTPAPSAASPTGAVSVRTVPGPSADASTPVAACTSRTRAAPSTGCIALTGARYSLAQPSRSPQPRVQRVPIRARWTVSTVPCLTRCRWRHPIARRCVSGA